MLFLRVAERRHLCCVVPKMRTRQVLLTLALLTAAPTAYAQAVPIEVIPPGDDRIEVLPKGQPAPFDGQLFDNDTALRWANWLRQYKVRLRVDVAEQRDVCAVRTTALQQQINVEQVKYSQAVTAYEQRLLQLQIEQANPPWYKSPIFYVATGVVTSALIFTGGFIAAK
jgi:hypothetical protein